MPALQSHSPSFFSYPAVLPQAVSELKPGFDTSAHLALKSVPVKSHVWPARHTGAFASVALSPHVPRALIAVAPSRSPTGTSAGFAAHLSAGCVD
jgi:hypothetical protein